MAFNNSVYFNNVAIPTNTQVLAHDQNFPKIKSTGYSPHNFIKIQKLYLYFLTQNIFVSHIIFKKYIKNISVKLINNFRLKIKCLNLRFGLNSSFEYQFKK